MIHILHLFTLLFVGLKLTGHIAWSWWLVLLPSYFVVSALLVIAAVCLCIAGVAWLFMSKDERARAAAARALQQYNDALLDKFRF